jgi:RNA polymerase sigma-70 factor (ECF subfamily)
MALCLRVLGDRAEAEEAVTDVFWQVWQQAGRFDLERGQPIAWLSTLARTRAIDRRRSLARRRSMVLPETTAPARAPSDFHRNPIRTRTPVGAQRGDRVRRALGSLAPETAARGGVELLRRALSSGHRGGARRAARAIKTRIRTGLAG